MKKLYADWMNNWENRLCSRATNRVVRPFEWGLEWTQSWPAAQKMPQNGHTPHQYLSLLNRETLEASEEFFGYETPSDFALRNRLLTFTSPVKTPYPANDVVKAQWFPAAE